MNGIPSITTVNKQQLLLENVQKVSQLLALQEELKEASSELESNHVELKGMISQLQEQQIEKENLVEQLKQKEEASKKEKEQLLEESKKVEKEKELIEGAIRNEEERVEKGSAFFGQSNIPSYHYQSKRVKKHPADLRTIYREENGVIYLHGFGHSS